MGLDGWKRAWEPMLGGWRRLAAARPLIRWPAKLAIFVLVTTLVLYPKPWLLVRHIDRLRHLNLLAHEREAELDALARQVQQRVAPGADAAVVFAAVEELVGRRIRYAFDWNTWGVADYLPSLAEVLEKGQEDCDGRALVAAALLGRLGYHPRLVANWKHMWVVTERGELMKPAGAKGVEATDRGTRLRWGIVTSLPGSLAFGVAVFPLSRELIILLTFWWLLLHPASRPVHAAFGLMAMGAGLLILRLAAADPWRPNAFGCWVAVGAVVAGIVLTWRARPAAARPAGPRSRPNA